MKYIKSYANSAAYAADATTRKSLKSSTVSLMSDSGDIKFDGYGVFIDKSQARFGDVIVYDTIYGVRYMAGDSLPDTATETAQLFSARGVQAWGVVFYNDGQTCYPIYKSWSPAYRFAAGFQVAISGLNTSNGGSFTLKINTSSFNVSYSAGTLANIKDEILTAIAAFPNWTGAVDGNYVVITHNYYTEITEVSITVASGNETLMQVTPYCYQNMDHTILLPNMRTQSSVVRKSGVASWNAGANYERFLQFYRVSGTQAVNQPVTYTEVLRESVFTETANPALFNKYNGDYEAYIQDNMAMYPAFKGTIADRGGKEWTEMWASITYQDINDVEKPAFPAAYFAHNANPLDLATGTGIGQGDLFLMDTWLALLADLHLKADGTDALNTSLAKIGGDTFLPDSNSCWLSVRYNPRNAWVLYSRGSVLNDGMCGIYRVRLCAAL